MQLESTLQGQNLHIHSSESAIILNISYIQGSELMPDIHLFQITALT